MAKKLERIFIFILVVISFNFFEARVFDNNTNVLYARYLIMVIAIILSFPYLLNKISGFVFPIQMIFASILFSVIMANFSWGQSLFSSFLATIPFMLWIFFFYLYGKQIPIDFIEKIIIIYGCTFIILYLYQFMHSQTPLFGSQDEFTEDRGVIRIIFPGGGALYLVSFLAITKFTTEKNKKILWFLLAAFGLTCTIMQVTRQSIFALTLIYFYHFIKELNIIQKIIYISVFIGVILAISFSNNPIVKGIDEAQKSTVEEGKSNIRIIAATYFMEDFSPNKISQIFGNGVPYALESYYALFVAKLKEEDGYYFSDVGVIGMYAMFGVFSILGLILIWFKSFKLKIPKKYYYAKYYLWYLLITSLTSNSVYSTDYLIPTVFALYIYQKAYESNEYEQ